MQQLVFLEYKNTSQMVPSNIYLQRGLNQYYEIDSMYWFGLSPGTYEKYLQHNLTHVVLF